MTLLFILVTMPSVFAFAKSNKPSLSKSDKNSRTSTKTEAYKELIAKAHQFMLQKDRAQAVNILLMAIQKEEPKSTAQSEITKALHKITLVFLNENSQSEYELALSLDKSDKKAALEKLTEILKSEPQNIQILRAIILRQLSVRNCKAAQKHFDDFMQINSYEPELAYFDIDIAICFKNNKKYLELRKKYESLIYIPSEFWYLSDIRINLPKEDRTNDFVYTKELIPKINPEILYINWKNPDLSKNEKFSFAEDYAKICKSWKTNYQTYNYLDPWVCENLKEVEDAKDKN